jgi:hypothetical protein
VYFVSVVSTFFLPLFAFYCLLLTVMLYFSVNDLSSLM